MERDIQDIGRSIQAYLDGYFKQWEGPLKFGTVFPRYALRVKALGYEMQEFVELLERNGFIHVFYTPDGARYIYSTNCPWDDEKKAQYARAERIDTKLAANEKRRKRHYAKRKQDENEN